jgi:TRAP-type C4-dicarboxylate transport system permease small subunit
MNGIKILAVLLIVAGVLVLIYGGFSYISDTHTTDLGLFKLTFQDKERVYIPVWAGVVTIVVGSALLLFFAKKK